ncbi:MAG: 30S ribosomal protein S16 [Candidatus Babeliales bacterium]
MSVKIRCALGGKKGSRYFRIVAVDSRNKRDGEFLEHLGTYDAVRGVIVTFNKEAVDAWIQKGAQFTDVTKKIYKQYNRV